MDAVAISIARHIFNSTIAWLNSYGYSERDTIKKLWELYRRIEEYDTSSLVKKLRMFGLVINEGDIERMKTIILVELEILIKNYEKSVDSRTEYV